MYKVMVSKEKENIVDLAWKDLHGRLEKDGLLIDAANHSERSFGRTVLFKWMAAAVVLLLGILSGLYMIGSTDVFTDDLLMVENRTEGLILATMLEDGSVVYLSDQTSLQYPDRFADHKREVVLEGEAFFDIRKQSDRPFVIDTDVATVEVVGTSFSVKSDGNGFLLSVRDGMVRVALKDKEQSVSVGAGETVLFDSDQLEVYETAVERFDEFVKRVHFKDERLGNIVHIVNMYGDSLQLKVDPELESRLLTFTTVGNDPAAIAELICLALNLGYEQQGNVIYISQQE